MLCLLPARDEELSHRSQSLNHGPSLQMQMSQSGEESWPEFRVVLGIVRLLARCVDFDSENRELPHPRLVSRPPLTIPTVLGVELACLHGLNLSLEHCHSGKKLCAS